MGLRQLVLTAAWLGCALATSRLPARPRPAVLVLRGGAVYTVDAARSWAQAVAIDERGRLAYVGTDAAVADWVGPRTRVIELSGKLVLPGLRDSHTHLISSGLELLSCDLTAATTRAQLEETVREYARAHPERAWVLGSGWALPLFAGAAPSRTLLDELVPDRPALLYAADGHSSWANSRALAAAGIDASTPDPPRGRIERDLEGVPSGTLREEASQLVQAHVPRPSTDEWRRGLALAQELAARFGLVGAQDANVDEERLAAYSDAERRGQLGLKLVAALATRADVGPEQVRQLERQRASVAGRRFLRATAAKVFVDGVIESHTAALLEPYLDAPHERGLPNYSPEALEALVTALDRAGFDVHQHAIGDRGVRLALDAIAAAQRANGRRDARHQIAHLELIDPLDQPRFRALGIVANFQALWHFADGYITDLTLPKIGPQRSRWLYPQASLARTGAVLAGGSDWSVSSLNPLEAIEVGLTRRALGATEGEALLPEERLSLPELIASYTIAGAYVAREERESGSLETGKWADLIVLDKHLFAVPPEQIHTARVLLTLVEGRETWRAPEPW